MRRLPHLGATHIALFIASLLTLLAGAAQAQTVGLQGTMGNRALLIIGQGAPRMLSPGESQQGVRLISAGGDEAVIEVAGQRRLLRIGDAPASVGGSGQGASGSRVVLTAGSGGHFTSHGTINGRAVQFMVDTGASYVAMGISDAERAGLNYKAGRPVQIATANGMTLGYALKLASVRIGDVETYEVDAVVTPQPMPYILLGNSFLNRFQMKRDNEQMVLERRF